MSHADRTNSDTCTKTFRIQQPFTEKVPEKSNKVRAPAQPTSGKISIQPQDRPLKNHNAAQNVIQITY